MSRFHQVQNNAKTDLVSSCESYITRMLKNKKTDRPYIEQRSLRDKSLGRSNNHLVMCRPITKPCPVPIVKPTEHIERQLSQELLHKEVFNNNMATVEVTVRTVAPQKGTQPKNLTAEKRESWAKLLAKQNSEDSVIGNFSTFDPLRTLHFLSQELQLKLNMLCPGIIFHIYLKLLPQLYYLTGDATIHKIVSDMQSAMQRLPPDVITQLKPTEENCFRVSSSYKNVNKVTRNKIL